jgi:hypothetical protein
VHWVNILLPIATLIIGSALTMAGQALSDRRREASERRARREQFRVANFDMHRTAMLEMQEVARDLASAVISESLRRKQSGDYDFFDSYGAKTKENYLAFGTYLSWMEQVQERTRSVGIPEGERDAFTAEVLERASEVTEVAKESKSHAEALGKRLEERSPFQEEFVKFMKTMRLCMYRSGSNTVVRYGEEYIQAVAAWNGHLVSKGEGELHEQLRKSGARLNRALANALTSGPYDTFKDDGD